MTTSLSDPEKESPRRHVQGPIFKKAISQTSPGFYVSAVQVFWNTVGKARYEQLLLFQKCFVPICRTFCHFHHIWNCCLQTLSVWKSLKFVVWERVRQLKVSFNNVQTVIEIFHLLSWLNHHCKQRNMYDKIDKMPWRDKYVDSMFTGGEGVVVIHSGA